MARVRTIATSSGMIALQVFQKHEVNGIVQDKLTNQILFTPQMFITIAQKGLQICREFGIDIPSPAESLDDSDEILRMNPDDLDDLDSPDAT